MRGSYHFSIGKEGKKMDKKKIQEGVKLILEGIGENLLPIRRLLSPMSHRHLRRMEAAHHREDHEPSAVRTD